MNPEAEANLKAFKRKVRKTTVLPLSAAFGDGIEAFKQAIRIAVEEASGPLNTLSPTPLRRPSSTRQHGCRRLGVWDRVHQQASRPNGRLHPKTPFSASWDGCPPVPNPAIADYAVSLRPNRAIDPQRTSLQGLKAHFSPGKCRFHPIKPHILREKSAGPAGKGLSAADELVFLTWKTPFSDQKVPFGATDLFRGQKGRFFRERGRSPAGDGMFLATHQPGDSDRA
jgi:hypothetical protein